MSLNPRQFEQLQMFMKPSEMRATPGFHFGDADYGREPDPVKAEASMQAMKRTNLDRVKAMYGDRTLRSTLDAEGIRTPVEVEHASAEYAERRPDSPLAKGPRLANGHHRFTYAEEREQAGQEIYLPVEHWKLG